MAQPDEITEWMARNGRTMLDLAAAKQLAAESSQQWYIASHGAKGFLVGKMTMQKYSARHILVDEAGQPMMFPTIESATAFLRSELKIANPHVFNY